MFLTRSIGTWRDGRLLFFVRLMVFFIGLPFCLAFCLGLSLICILGTPVGLVLFYTLPNLAKLFPVESTFSRLVVMVSANEKNDLLIYPTLFSKKNNFIIPAYLTAIFAGLIFGGLHCAGWNFTYPTTTERTTWRVMSLALVVIPFLGQLSIFPVVMKKNLFFLYIASGDSGEFVSAGSPLFLLVFACLGSLYIIGYVVARLCLIALALAALREQPASAYVAVKWTKLIPHP